MTTTNLDNYFFTEEGRPCRIRGNCFMSPRDYDRAIRQDGRSLLWDIDGFAVAVQHTKRGYVQLHADSSIPHGERKYVYDEES